MEKEFHIGNSVKQTIITPKFVHAHCVAIHINLVCISIHVNREDKGMV